MEKAISKALEELDSLGESAIRKKILGLDAESPEEDKKEDGEEDDSSLLEQFKAALSKE